MSSTKSEQTTTLTYLANNCNYDATTINFDLHLPSPSGFTYEFGPAFNISKNIGGTEVNAICFFMKKNRDNDIVLATTANTSKPFKLSIGTLIDFSDTRAIPFDDKKNTACIIVIHNHSFSLDLVDACFNGLETHISGLTPYNSPRIIPVAKKSIDKILVPRKLGVSIITR